MVERHIEPREAAELVERYVDRELADAEKCDNREPLDESGVYSLHVLAGEIYMRGFRDGEDTERVRARGERLRKREGETGHG